ncbi:hypothetical protein BDV25DRAFT_141583 [Aspergillus avenaceus]|uniref:Rhodopsin domain-containing protein n=1 Tax=Aspergillus avenaceus TaxID=36643 RepID=A0A5N6TQL5_ASPAV|nr:hypothetical protein BDV25DRAFT_141583 [Aspergillus avenaceus]
MDALQDPPGGITDDRQKAIIGVNSGFIVFGTIVIALRVYARTVILHALGIDDVLMIIGTVVSLGLSVSTMMGAYYGIGKHIHEMRKQDLVPMLKSLYAARLLYVGALAFVKLSLLWFYLRLDQRRWMRLTVYSMLIINLAVEVASAIYLALACMPPSLFWDYENKHGHCFDPVKQQVLYDSNGIFNIITDIIVYILPIIMLWRIRITKRQRYALYCIFGLGIFSILAGCVRFSFVRRISNQPEDPFQDLGPALNWCCVEVYFGIFCGSAPALSVILKTYVPHWLGSVESQAHNSRPPRDHSSAPRSTWPSASYKSRQCRGADTGRYGSQGNLLLGKNAILMRTDITMEVTDRNGRKAEDARSSTSIMAHSTSMRQ